MTILVFILGGRRVYAAPSLVWNRCNVAISLNPATGRVEYDYITSILHAPRWADLLRDVEHTEATNDAAPVIADELVIMRLLDILYASLPGAART